MKDLHSNLSAVVAHVPAVVSATANGATVDLQGFDSAEIIINTGAIVSSGLFVASVEESDNGSDWTEVAAADLLGALPASLAASTVYQVGYRGGARYIRAPLTKTSGTSIAAGVVVVKGDPAIAPVA